VNGPVSNVPQFYQAFNIQPGSKCIALKIGEFTFGKPFLSTLCKAFS
jgi:hypothetical protein